ncbi:MAG: hypothetical protein HOZ81_48980 [Streptomyces sp.]|nr:hypothetical protein [Streptomyces sp.]NUT29624.1 hypothetical protein [Streptomyces sp.]
MGEHVKIKLASLALLGSVTVGATPAYAGAAVFPDQSTTSLDAPAVGNPPATVGDEGRLHLASDEQYVQTFGAAKAAARGLTYQAGDQAVSGAAADRAGSHWSVVKFSAHDKDGRYIPTRQGNREFGWVHFSGPHNIHNEKVIKAAVNEHPESGSTKTRKVYGAVLYDNLGIILARVKVIAQYHWETSDKKYKLADHDDKIGVITAFCQGSNKCPDALNRV